MRVLAVVVRYNMALGDSQTLKGLCEAFAADPALAESYDVLIWDNSPEPLADPQLPIPFAYRHSERNLGVSGAYNSAMEYARKRGHPWMLLLDQDTAITGAFLEGMGRHLREVDGMHACAAIVPTVKVRGKTMSPKHQLFNRHKDFPAGECGVAPGEVVAINSGCMMRVEALSQIGGFSTDFWLDFSDIYVFHHFYRRGMEIWRAADIEIEHDMSIMDYDRLMTPWRYTNFSYAESAFHDLYRSRLENSIQTLRLFARAIKQRFKYKSPVFSRIAWEQFVYRVRVRRKERIARWQAEGRRRLGRSEA